MALPLRRLAGLLFIAAAIGCPKAVDAPTVKIANTAISGVQIGQVVRLDASGSVDPQGRDLSFAWQFTAIPVGSAAALNDAHSATPSFLADVDGEYDVQVVVSNAFVSAAAATAKVTVSKCGGRAPVFGSNAITARDAARSTVTNNFAVGATVVLSSDVNDPDNATTDGVCTATQNQAVSYQWKLVGIPAGSAATLNNASASSPSFVADVSGTYLVRLIATDSTGRSSAPFDQSFTVGTCGANAPTISSSTPVTEQLAVGTTIQMSVVADDADNGAGCQAVLGAPQTFTYRWSMPQLPNGSHAVLNSVAAQNPSFSPDIDGDYTVRVVVTDSTGRSSDPKDAAIHVPKCGNNAPVAAITGPSTGFLGQTIQFGETLTDPDGPVNGGAQPASPACNPTIDQSVSLQWSILALPAGSKASLNNATGTNPTLIPDVGSDDLSNPAVYTLQLVATDQSGLSSAPATKSISVSKCGKNAPTVTFTTASAQVNSGTQVTVSATTTNRDSACIANETFSYSWSLASKPAGSNAFISAAPASPDTLTDSASFVADAANGTYQVQLVVTSSTGVSSAPAFISFFTNDCGTNAPTIVSAAPDNASPNAGLDTVTLTAAGDDVDNKSTPGGLDRSCKPALSQQQSLSFQWTLVSRPSGSGTALTVLTSPTDGSKAQFKPDVIGPYQFSVVVTDSTGLSSPPTFVTVQTSGCGSHAPSITSAAALPSVAQSGNGAGKVTAGGSPTGSHTYVVTISTGGAPGTAQYTVRIDGGAASAPATVPVSGSVVADANGVALGFSGASFNAGDTYTFVTQPRPTLDAVSLVGAVADLDDACFGGTQPRTVQWTVVSRPSGSSAVIASPTSLTASFVPDVPGAYQFALNATDSLGLKAAPAFTTVVASSCSVQGPAVLAIAPDTATQFASYPFATPTVDFSRNCLPAAASNPKYAWAIVSAPSGSTAALSDPAAAAPSFTPDKVGSYQFALTVTNGVGISAAPVFFNLTALSCGRNPLGWSSVAVTQVFDPDPAPAGTTFTGPSIPANPNAGATVTVNAAALETNPACGTHTDPITYQWAIVAAPSGSHATLTSTTGASPAFVPDVPDATYQLSVVATDALGNVSSAPNFVSVHTAKCGANVPTVAINPSGSATIYDRTAQSLTATPADADNSCPNRFHVSTSSFTYAWSISSQPANGSATLGSATGSGTTFQASVPGTYTVHVVTTAPNGISSDPTSASSFVALTVRTCGSAAPVVNSISTFAHGTASPLSRPSVGQQVDLVANATDADAAAACNLPSGNPGPGANVTSYTWTAVSLPSGSTAPSIFSAAQSTFSFTPDVAGTFVYSVVATDDTALQSAPVQVSVSTAHCEPVFGGIRAAAGGAFLAISAANTASSQTNAAITLDVPPSVTHSGPGTGTVSASGTPSAAHRYVVTIADATHYTLSVDGGVASAPIAMTTTSLSNGTANLVFSGTFNATDTYSFATSTNSLATDSCVTSPSMAYAWSLTQKPATSGATLSSLSGASPQLTPDVPGTYAVQVTVTDNAGLSSAPAVLTFNVASCGVLKPSVGALVATPPSPDQGSLVALTAPNISDPNAGPGCNGASISFTYEWSLISTPNGSSARLTSTTAANPWFVADLPSSTYQVALTVTDSLGNVSDPSFLPVISSNCGAVAPFVQLVGSPAVADFMLTQDLTVNGGAALHAVHAADTTANAATLGGAATTLKPLYPGVPVQLDATVNDGHDACALTKTVHYQWSIASAPAGSTAQINNPTAPSPSFTPDLPGAYDFQLVLADQNGFSSTNALSKDTAGLHPGEVGTCGTKAPTAVASVTGPIPGASPANEPLGERSQLDASGSTSPDDFRTPGQSYPNGCGLSLPLSYDWVMTSAPGGSTATLSSATLKDPSFSPDLPGLYSAQVTVTDPRNNSATATAVVNGVGGFASVPATTGAVLTATTTDGSGTPYVAWWDNTSGSVAAAKCIANCAGPNAIWNSLGTIDSGLNPMTIPSPADEPRPIGAAFAAGNLYVAYYTSTSATTTAGAHGMPACGVALAIYNGAWSWHGLTTGTATCNATGTAAPDSGRWLSVSATTAQPAVGYSVRTGASSMDPRFTSCADPACLTVNPEAVIWNSPSFEFGRWIGLHLDASGPVAVSLYLEETGLTQIWYFFAPSVAVANSSNATASSFALAQIESTAAANVGRFLSMATNASETERFFVYRDQTNQFAKYTSCPIGVNGSCGPFTARTQIPDAASTDYGLDTVGAYDSHGVARIAYFDATNSQVRVIARDNSGGFQTTGLLDANSTPVGLSMAFGTGVNLAFDAKTTPVLKFFTGP